jgi:hypothetical protein
MFRALQLFFIKFLLFLIGGIEKMLELNFKEPETFKTPDGTVWTINPLKRRDLKRLHRFTALNEKLQKLKEEGRTDEANTLIFGKDEDDDQEETLLKITDEIIDLSITNDKGEQFPEIYRRQITKTMELCVLVINASVDSPKGKEGDGNPSQKATSGKTSE